MDFIFIVYSENSLKPIEGVIHISDKIIKIDKIHSVVDIQKIISLPEPDLSTPNKHGKFNLEHDTSISAYIADDFTLDVLSNLDDETINRKIKKQNTPIKPKLF